MTLIELKQIVDEAIASHGGETRLKYSALVNGTYRLCPLEEFWFVPVDESADPQELAVLLD